MTSRGLVIVACAGCICLLAPSMMLTRAHDASNASLVEVSGLKPSYTSCELVSFAVKNISKQELYVEVYAEKFDSGSWDDVDFPYDIRDPRSLYIMKRLNTSLDKMKPGASQSLTWDRCLRPTWATWENKKSDKAFRRSIVEKDSKSDPPILQRLRVDIYNGPGATVKSLQRVYLEPFKRITNKQSAR
jgi:hypothetical protein